MCELSIQPAEIPECKYDQVDKTKFIADEQELAKTFFFKTSIACDQPGFFKKYLLPKSLSDSRLHYSTSTSIHHLGNIANLQDHQKLTTEKQSTSTAKTSTTTPANLRKRLKDVKSSINAYSALLFGWWSRFKIGSK